MSHNIYCKSKENQIKGSKLFAEQEKKIQKIRLLAELINELNARIANARLKKQDIAFKALYKKIIDNFHDNQVNNSITYKVLSEVMGKRKDFNFSYKIRIDDMQEIALNVNKIMELIEYEQKI